MTRRRRFTSIRGFKSWKEITTPDDVALLDKLNEPMTTKFKVGDKVVGLNDWKELGLGFVTKSFVQSEAVGVRFDGFTNYFSANDCHSVYPAYLQLIPHSPQPQQNQTKEDTMKPYAVIYQNLSNSTAANINSTHTTEAEAKEAAEQVVASQRADLTQKNYFTVSILNTKTGELIGSVSDAPPVVDWARK